MIFFLAVGDYVEGLGFQSSGGTLAMVGNTTNVLERSFMQAEFRGA